ncbi:murein biosynthesis integral membrane protein MurJ [Nocardioides limicola]|uniref:murein biosynthesis integral membrane protein MurJ n=1 Tax=Nocardioides limicola TaxID=2803368 RepID=UPI0027DE44AC|nr:murein biosynthesis integral membrane protein MurJ [Nocardioides sp. DJM-14]
MSSEERSAVLSSSALMATGTVFSRISGYLRNILLAAALGNLLHADVFTIANTVPNMIYILLAGGIFNAVLVPQLVRAMQNDPDGGEAYTNRVITLAALFLVAVSVLLVVCAPWVMRLYLDPQFYTAEYDEQRQSVINFARYCLPQVFFYGMFVLVGQILNSRRRFGPMMWAPIANNAVSIAVLLVYLFVFGPARGDQLRGGYEPSQELLLGLGSTFGIAVQFLILLPYLKAAGFSYRPRFDFRDTGLGHTLRLGAWTLGFVIVNQIAYTVVVRLASSGTLVDFADGGDSATGYTVYAGAYLLMMAPHAVVTVSLATAILPRLSASAAGGEMDGVRRTLSGTLRTALAFIVPAGVLLPLLAYDIAEIVWGYGAASLTASNYAPTLGLFGPALVLFTVHYMMLRGFFALERNRTAFWVQCVIATANVSLALILVPRASIAGTAPALAVAWGGAYLIGACVSYLVLRRLVGGLETGRLLLFLVRLVPVAVLAVAVGWMAARGLDSLIDTHLPDAAIAAGKPASLLVLVTTTMVAGIAYLLLARIARIREVSEIGALVTRRLPGRRRSRSDRGSGVPE